MLEENLFGFYTTMFEGIMRSESLKTLSLAATYVCPLLPNIFTNKTSSSFCILLFYEYLAR
jgi:hypothetical protein